MSIAGAFSLPPLPVLPVRILANGAAYKSLSVPRGVDPVPHLRAMGVPLIDGPALSVQAPGTLYTWASSATVEYRWHRHDAPTRLATHN